MRKQKTDRRDAGHILKLLMEDRFPRIRVPSAAERDQRQLLLHRSKLVRMRTRVKTELQHLALNQGMQKKRHLWSVRGRADFEDLPLQGWTRQLPSYPGLIPREGSSGSRRRLGAIGKQGNQFLRTLLVEAAQSAVQHDPEMCREYRHRCHHKAKGVAKVAAARRISCRCWTTLQQRARWARGG